MARGQKGIARKVRPCLICGQQLPIVFDKKFPCIDCRIKRRPKTKEGFPLPPGPTEALPGTEEKIVALAERVANGLKLWHPADAVRDDEREI